MKVLNIVAVMSPESGGLARSVQGFVAGLCQAGVDAWICPLDGTEPWIPGVRKFTQTLSTQTLKHFDLVHIHGIWNWGLHKVAAMCRKAGVPYVIVPSGMLEPWSLKQKGLKKRIARWLYQDKDLRYAAALHATAESEAEQFRRLGFKNKIIVSPNGVNVPEGEIRRRRRAEAKAAVEAKGAIERSEIAEGLRELTGMPTTGEAATVEVTHLKSPSTHTILKILYAVNGAPRRALFVSRMHPKKGVLELVESWARVMKSGKSVVSNRITENWFDVESPDIIRGLPTIRVSATEEALADRRAIKAVFRGFGSVVNAADGRKVTFPSKSAGKMLGQRGVDLYRLAGSFAELFNKSRRAWSETEAEIGDHREHRNIGAYHQYIAKFNAGTEDCYIRFTVREEKGTKNSRNEVHSSTVSRVTVYKAKGAELSNLGHAQAEDSTPFVDSKIAYFFTRVNPAWRCELVYTVNGPEEKAYEQKVKDRILALGMSYQDKDGTIHCTTTTSSYDFLFTGPLDDTEKWNAYARADLFVLPTYSENFGIVVAEALWAGVPVITTKGAPWAELEERKCGWWIELAALDNALREACGAAGVRALPEMGKNGRALIEERYTWKAICAKMAEEYGRLELRLRT